MKYRMTEIEQKYNKIDGPRREKRAIIFSFSLSREISLFRYFYFTVLPFRYGYFHGCSFSRSKQRV